MSSTLIANVPAHIAGDATGATFKVDGTTYPIPDVTTNGSRSAAPRLAQALHDAGFAPANGDYHGSFTSRTTMALRRRS